jgi:threonylcarbamoyladenosine tRNA methylthiotransferase MtaB
MKASFSTFGCKLNQYESEALASAFRSQGFSLVPAGQDADLYVVNTCTVTSRSEQKARRLIRRLGREHPEATIVVTGCYAQLNGRDIQALGENVRVVPQEAKTALLDLPRQLVHGGGDSREGWSLFPTAAPTDPFAYRVESFSFHSRAFLKIQDGCDGRCAYCRVPLARGGSVSLPAEDAVARLRALEEAGYREVVLTGVNITDYRGGLEGLLRSMLAHTRSMRLRLSSLEPECVTPGLADVLAAPRIRPHFHVPAQSGSESVLRRMRRRYTPDTVIAAFARLRAAKGDPFLAADLIVGFPGESDEDFARTRELVETLELSDLHVFPFSPRPGTAAVGMTPRVPERLRDARAAVLLELAARLRRRYAQRWVGARLEAVLAEPLLGSVDGEGGWRGLTENYLEVEIGGVPPVLARRGELVSVLVDSATGTARRVHGRYGS